MDLKKDRAVKLLLVYDKYMMNRMSIFFLIIIIINFDLPWSLAEESENPDNSLSVHEVSTVVKKSEKKKLGFGGKDAFDLLLGTKDRDLMQAQTHDTKFISEVYRSGNFLIYDCVRGNYACVNKDGFEYCKSVREESLKEGDKILSCAPLKKFNRYQFCIEQQKVLVDYPVDKLFCIRKDVIDQ